MYDDESQARALFAVGHWPVNGFRAPKLLLALPEFS
jgi:hypothetical protein